MPRLNAPRVFVFNIIQLLLYGLIFNIPCLLHTQHISKCYDKRMACNEQPMNYVIYSGGVNYFLDIIFNHGYVQRK